MFILLHVYLNFHTCFLLNVILVTRGKQGKAVENCEDVMWQRNLEVTFCSWISVLPLIFSFRKTSNTLDWFITFSQKKPEKELIPHYWTGVKTYSQPCQTSKVYFFGKLAHGFKQLTIFCKSSILDIIQ